MRHLHANRKSFLYTTLSVAFMISLLTVGIFSAEDEMFNWNKQDTMDTGLVIVENKAGDDDILLEMNVEESGTYGLTYYLQDGYQTYLEFVQGYESFTIEYHVYENDGAGGSVDVTQERVSASFLEMDYDLEVPDWTYDGDKLVGDSGGLEYIIERSASDEYPGVAIDVDNMQLILKWDFANDTFYALIKDYEDGKIMPIEFVTPDTTSYEINVLKNVEGFEVVPTHYYTTDGAVNVQLNPVELPNDASDTPGSRPGLDITFKQPMVMDPNTWAYTYSDTDLVDITAILELEDVETNDYFDLSLLMKEGANQLIGDLDDDEVNEDVAYVYEDYTYTLHLVEDKSDLALQDTFIQWPSLAPSSIYNVNLYMEVDLNTNAYDNYEFTTYEPEDGFGYTYMAYELTRASAEEAYLDITPFNVGEQDEVEYSILYSKTVKSSLDADEDLWLDYYHNAEEEEIFIPVPFSSTSSKDAYQVLVTFSGVELTSQVLNYKAVEDENVPLTTPTIEDVANLFVVPTIDGSSEDPDLVKFDLEWTAPTNDEVKELDTIFEDLDGLDNDRIYYELSVNDLPTDENDNPFEVVKVFVVSQSDAGDYVLDLYQPDDDSAEASTTVNFIEGYNETDSVFRMDDIIIRRNDLWSNVLETTIDDAADTYTVTDTGDQVDITFPGVSYIRVKAISLKDGEIASSTMSVPASLSLSMEVYDVPTVDILSYEPIYVPTEDGTSGITLQWESVDISSYASLMLEPLDVLIEDMRYSVYITEDKEALEALDVTQEITMEAVDQVTLDEGHITALNEGEVLFFDLYVDPEDADFYEIDIEGLEANRTYYTRIYVSINVKDEVDTGQDPVEKVSDPSSILSITTPLAPEAPTDEEVIPLAPEDFSAVFADDSEVKALLEWVMPDELAFEEDAYGFELFSVVDRSMPADLLGTNLALTDIISDEIFTSDVIEAWRIYVYDNTTYLEKYDIDVEAFYDLDLAQLSIEGQNFQLDDGDNAPNRVNYYYIRSVKMLDQTATAASSWVPVTLTTSPTQGPINLIVDYDTTYDYEAKTEAVIQFDAPIGDESDLGSDYIMEIYVLGEDDIEYSMTDYPAEYLGSEGEIESGYLRLSYAVTELVSGKSYDIKVRIEDRTQEEETLPDGSTRYPISSFSEVVTARTDFDQEAYDKENKYYDYINYYWDQAEALKLVAYFMTQDDAVETAVKYRESYTTGLIQLSSSGELELYSNSNSINTYYIPSSSLEDINEMDVTMVIKSKDHIGGIRPETVGATISDEIEAIIDDIGSYDTDNEDYYLRIRFFTDTYQGTINGQEPSGDLVEMDISVVGSRLSETDMDDLMVDLLDKIILAHEDDLIEAIEEDLDKGIDDDALLEIVQEVLEDVKSEFVGQGARLFRGYLSNSPVTINGINHPIYVGLMPEDETLTYDVYTKGNSNWQFTNSAYYNGRYLVDGDINQPYVALAQGDSDLAVLYGQDAVDVVNRYGLASIFSQYDLEHPDEYVDKYQWLSALSILLGARNSDDPVDYLEAMAIDLDDTDLYRTFARDEGLYLYAQAYEDRHHVNLSSTFISNYFAINDMSLVDKAYQETLLQAENYGILPNYGGNLKPRDTIDMATALELLTILEQGIY